MKKSDHTTHTITGNSEKIGTRRTTRHHRDDEQDRSSDHGRYGCVQHELAAFVLAGLTPGEALKTATYNPAKFLGMLDRLGTVEKGKLADLVLLDANPLETFTIHRKSELRL